MTAWELDRAGIPVTLICDHVPASLMAQGLIDLVLVGTDRVTLNGDVVNKIGTLNLAVLCQHFHIPFYVACPSTTFDPHTLCGDDVTIEERDPAEVLSGSAADVNAYNPGVRCDTGRADQWHHYRTRYCPTASGGVTEPPAWALFHPLMSRYRPPAPRSSAYITPMGHRRLQSELKELWQVKRPEVTAKVQEAAAQGDRSENAEYIYGKKQLREIDGRIRYLAKRLDVLTVIDPGSPGPAPGVLRRSGHSDRRSRPGAPIPHCGA